MNWWICSEFALCGLNSSSPAVKHPYDPVFLAASHHNKVFYSLYWSHTVCVLSWCTLIPLRVCSLSHLLPIENHRLLFKSQDSALQTIHHVLLFVVSFQVLPGLKNGTTRAWRQLHFIICKYGKKKHWNWVRKQQVFVWSYSLLNIQM